MSKDSRTQLAAAVCCLALVGCGGGSSRDDTTPGATAQVAKGTVTGFGSVFVNGVEWETTNTTFSLDDAPGSETELEVGHIVVVRGTIGADGVALADSIEHDAEVEGTVSAVNGDTLTVAGLTVTVNADTVYDDDLPTPDLDGVAPGDYVEISALVTADGYLATRIDLEVDDGDIEVYGEVTGLDTSASTFMIHDLTVDYSGAAFEDFDGQPIADGNFVEVEGSGFGSGGELVAVRVELEDNNPYDDGDEFEIEGVISAVNEDGSFEINGVTLTLAPDVEFEHGSLASLVENVKVEVEGEVDALGNLVVDEVEFKAESNIEVEAPLDAVSGNMITVLGVDFAVADTTQYEDSSIVDETYFDLADVMAGDWVKVKAFRDEVTGTLVATRVERDDPSELVELTAPLEATSGDVLTLLGIDAITTANTVLDDDSGFASVADLITNVSLGTLIEIEGVASQGVDGFEILVSEIGIDD